MNTYIVKMNGMKVRSFNDPIVAKAWAMKHCKGKVTIMLLTDCKRNPVASRQYFNELMENKEMYRINPFKTAELG